jgi:transposase
LAQLWQEYQETHKEGPRPYGYTQFCGHYKAWLGKQDLVMRQDHRAGEKLFVDYTEGLSIVDRETGEVIPTALFLGVWGASNYTYAEASLNQQVPQWTRSHVRALEYFQCAPHVLVPDNLKSAVLKPCFYDPELNRSYAEMAQHYGCVVLPARPYHARDKAKVEAGVLVAKRWILAVLRHRTFFSLEDLNAAIWELLERLNARPLRKVKKSRREIFEALDRPAARRLPECRYEYADWKKARVNIDYHIDVAGHLYSVPYQLAHEQLDVRLTATTLEAFHKGERVAAHARSYVAGGRTTNPGHMPPSHQKHLEWTPSRMKDWAAKTGPATAAFVDRLMASRPHPEQGYRAVLGIMNRLVPAFTPERVEAASRRALRFNTLSYRSLHTILAAGLDRVNDEPQPDRQPGLPLHENVRGQTYYH